MRVEVDAAALSRLNRDLRRAANPAEVRRRLRKGLRDAAKPLVPAVRSSVMATPSRQHGKRRDGRRGLRRLIGSSVTLQVKVGSRARVRVFMDPKKVPDGMKALPLYLDGKKPFWRHPRFGHRGEGDWFEQAPHPYFDRATASADDRARAAIAQVANDIARELDRDG